MKKGIWILGLVLLFFLLTSFRVSKIKNITNSLPRHPDKDYAKRDLSAIDQIVIHHSATPEDTTALSIANYHVGPNHISDDGIPGIAYHFLIDVKGQILQVNELTTISWHTSGQNTRSIGICLIGNFDEISPSKAHYKSLIYLIRYLRKKLGPLEIAGHNEYANKSCPGDQIDWELIQLA
jgi:N-acetyl-anhydromuramyl-L-alanine amidase AmpD